MAVEQKWDVKDGRSPELSKQQNQMGYAVYVEGYFGQPVLTNIGLQSFITSFEHIIKTMKDRLIINSTQGGARIPETIQMSLSHVKKEYCKKRIVRHKKKIKRIYRFQMIKESLFRRYKIKKAQSIINNEIKDLGKAIKAATSGLKWNKKIETYDKEANNLIINALDQNERYSREAHQFAIKNALLTSSIYQESREINGAEYKDIEGKLNYNKNKDNIGLRIKKNRIILETVKKEATTLIESYQNTLIKLRKLLESKSAFKQDDDTPSLEDADSYFKSGNWAIPYLEACRIIDNKSKQYPLALSIYDKCIKMRNDVLKKTKSLPDETTVINYNEILREAIKKGREENDFENSMMLLNKAYELMPEKPEAIWGRATIFCFFQYYQNSLEEYDKLLKIAKEKDLPDYNIQKFKFERALVLLNININQGISDLLELIKENKDFSYF